MDKLVLTKQQARRFLLAYQGIWPQSVREGKAGIVDYIRRPGCIQFDPLNIVGHNQELVLQARIPHFRPVMLQELLYEERKLLDGWDKNMSIYCVEDWPYFRRCRESALQKLGNSSRPVAGILDQVRRDIERQGPLSSLELDYDQTVDWPWAPTRLARAALESMYFWGELIIHHKVNTRKVYDYVERHIPQALLTAGDPNEALEDYHDWYVLRRIGGIGLLWNRSGDAWLGISGLNSGGRKAALSRLLEKGKAVEVTVDGISSLFYMRTDDRKFLTGILHEDTFPAGTSHHNTVSTGTLRDDAFPTGTFHSDALPTGTLHDDTLSIGSLYNNTPQPRAAILAPLDNLLWDRRLVKELFDFEYRWEVYKPVKERQYGYYVLPVLYGDRFVARFEPGRDPKSGDLLIKNWWWEQGISQSEKMRTALSACFKEFLNYLGSDRLSIDPKTSEQADLAWLDRAKDN